MAAKQKKKSAKSGNRREQGKSSLFGDLRLHLLINASLILLLYFGPGLVSPSAFDEVRKVAKDALAGEWPDGRERPEYAEEGPWRRHSDRLDVTVQWGMLLAMAGPLAGALLGLFCLVLPRSLASPGAFALSLPCSGSTGHSFERSRGSSRC